MPRLMSFAETVGQIRDRSKTVTRRMSWWDLEAGEEIIAVAKSMGLQKGEKVERLAHLRIVSTRVEELHDIRPEDVAAEGFPSWSREDFITFFCQTNKCLPDDLVNRIEFEYI